MMLVGQVKREKWMNEIIMSTKESKTKNGDGGKPVCMLTQTQKAVNVCKLRLCLELAMADK